MTSELVQALERESMAMLRDIDSDQAIACVIAGDATKDEYARFLESTYHYLRWSGPLLARTAAGLRRVGHYPWLFEMIDAKTRQEKVHDVWVLNDLKNLGIDIERVKSAPVPSAVRAYVEWGWTMAESGSPAYLGSAFALEFLAAQRANTAAHNLLRRKVIPHIEGALSFLTGHGDTDIEHVEQLKNVFDQIDEPADQDAIAISAAVTRALYPRFFSRHATA